MVSLIIGGVRSGKSHYAQRLAMSAKSVVFLATAVPSDEEMRLKIEKHRKERPTTWKTIEVPLNLHAAISEYGHDNCLLLIDCLTTFTANLLGAEGENQDAIRGQVDRLCAALRSTAAQVVVVSNEVGSGIVPAFASGRRFRDLLGEINQNVARLSTNVILMVAGCPLALKGSVEALP